MFVPRKIKKYIKNNLQGVAHTTFNPKGPGVVRIHLIPPKYEKNKLEPAVVIINGQDIIPLNYSWTILLNEYIAQVNKYNEREVSDSEIQEILRGTFKQVHKVFPYIRKKNLENDLYTIMNTFKQIAYGQEVDAHIGYMSLREYAPYMKAPHRMDLMVSAMTRDGSWHCNQKCVHCYAAGQEHANEKELTTQEWKKIIDKCKEAGIPQITFTGGEPTMREDLVELIDYSQWFVTRLNTNGIKLTEELCANLYEASLDSVQITFYSWDEEIHNNLVGANAYSATVKGIENALAAGLNISINTPLCTENADYKKTLEFLHEKGVTYVTCSGLITTGNAATTKSENLQLTKEQIKDILRDATEYCFSNGMEISFTSPGWVEEEFCQQLGITPPSCGACLSNMAITPMGYVVPCQSWLSDETLGNMLEDDWEDIWNNDKTIKHRQFSAQMQGPCPLRIYREDKTGGAC